MHSVLASLLDVLPRIENQMVRNGALTVGASLAAADLDAVVKALLTQPVPLGSAAAGLAQRSTPCRTDRTDGLASCSARPAVFTFPLGPPS